MSLPTYALRGFVIALTLASSTIAQAPSRDASFGVWPWLVGNIDADVPSIVAHARTRGYETIYVHVFSSTGVGTGDLRIEDESHTWSPSWGSVRPLVRLSNLIAQAHAQNVRVIAVMNCFYETTPTPDDAAHRDYLAYDVIDYLVNTMDAQGRPVYALDGVALDRVRYYAGPRTHHNVTDFVRKAREVLGHRELHAYVPANAWVIDGPAYDARFNTYSYVIQEMERTYGLNYEVIAPYVDTFLPMAYTSDGHVYGSNYTNMQAYVETCARYLKSACVYGGSPATRVTPAIRAWNDTSGTTTPQSIDASARGALLGGGEGFNVFRYYTSRTQTSWWNALATHVVSNPNRPTARVQVAVDGLTVTFDMTTSTDLDEPTSSLRSRVDWDGDGTWDTALANTLVTSWLVTAAGTYDYAVEVVDSNGLFDREIGRYQVGNALQLSTTFLSIANGGQVDLQLRAGSQAMGAYALFLVTMSGTTPGTPLSPELTLPLNFDPLTVVTLTLANTPAFPNFFSTLDPQGRATASIVMPPGQLPPELLFQRLDACALGLTPGTLTPFFVSNPATFLFFP